MQPNLKNELDSTAPVTEQAAFWWVLLNEPGATAADHRAFGEWVVRSPERVAAFLQAAQLTHALESNQTQWPDTPAADLIREALASRHEVATLGARESRSVMARPARVTAWATAAGAGVAAVLAAVFLFYSGPQRFETAVGEQRSVVLTDGSLVTLNTSSVIEVRMVKDHRTVRLLGGEALFRVAHDAARPFDVQAGSATVRAIGTQFNVDRRPAETTVTVVEGRVAVYTGNTPNQEQATLPLGAGEQLTLVARTASRPVHADVDTVVAWTQRKLIFAHRQLGEVAAEFNRYNRQIIEIRSPGLRSQEVTGVFQANDPDSFLTFLAKLPDVTIEKTADHMHFIVRQEER